MKPGSVSATTTPSFVLLCFLQGLVLMMFTQHVLARTDPHFHEVSYRATQTTSDSQEVHEIDNKVMIVFSSWKLDHPCFSMCRYCGWLYIFCSCMGRMTVCRWIETSSSCGSKWKWTSFGGGLYRIESHLDFYGGFGMQSLFSTLKRFFVPNSSFLRPKCFCELDINLDRSKTQLVATHVLKLIKMFFPFPPSILSEYVDFRTGERRLSGWQAAVRATRHPNVQANIYEGITSMSHIRHELGGCTD